MGHQWTLNVATTVCVLVDDAALQNPAIQESPAGVAQRAERYKYEREDRNGRAFGKGE
jgi:hypothetical protein